MINYNVEVVVLLEPNMPKGEPLRVPKVQQLRKESFSQLLTADVTYENAETAFQHAVSVVKRGEMGSRDHETP